MQEVYIPHERIKKLEQDGLLLGRAASAARCKITLNSGENLVKIDGDAYSEFIAKNIITAFGRGFEMDTACLLVNDDYYFSYIDLKSFTGSEKRMLQIKARIIGNNGRAKRYIENVSGAKISVYGHTVGFVGRINDMQEAETAVRTLLEGGTHKLAYARMEAQHRKNKMAGKEVAF